MSAGNSQLIAHATKNLKLRDIVLDACKFDRPDVLPEDLTGVNLVQEHMRGGEFLVGEAYDAEGLPRTLRVKVTLGVRIATEDESPKVFVVVEASYVVIYDITGDLDGEHLKAFAEYNVFHNVWPFWRQHVFDIVSRGKLPQIEIPLFAGISL
jgi:hypothetical protein